MSTSNTIKKKDTSYSQSLGHGHSRAVSNVPQDVSDEDALTGAWQRGKLPSVTAQELDEKKIWDLRRGIGELIWRTEKTEHEVTGGQRRLKELKQELLYNSENVDKEIVDYGAHIAVEVHHVRKASELLERWVREAREEAKKNHNQ